MPHFIRIGFCCSCLTVFLLGCSVNPVTGKSEISLVSPEQEVALGQQNYGPMQQSQGGSYVVDRSVQNYVDTLGQQLAAVSDRPGLPWEFVVLNNSVPNAWALPGGKIAINRGLLVELEDEAELAAVLGHEVVHAAARHSAAQMTRGSLIGMTSQIATIAAATAGYGELGNTLSQAGGAAVMASYGRDDELEADFYGMKYMSDAGYDPQAAVSLQETFVRLSSGRSSDFVSGLFASHPPSQARVDANRRHAMELPKGGVRNRAGFERAIATMRRDQPAYDAQALALKALQDNNANAALKQLDRAVQLQPREAQFWELRGHAWSMLDNPDNAEKAYTTAISKNPDLFSPALYRGLLRYERDNFSGAQQDLYRSHSLLPTPAAAFYLGELALRDQRDEDALQYYAQASSSSSEKIATQAKQQMARLELPGNPGKYIQSQVFLADDAYLRIAIRNASSVAVSGISVQLIDTANGGNRAVSVPGQYQLQPGEQLAIKTLLGPFEERSQIRRYRSSITAARVADEAQAR